MSFDPSVAAHKEWLGYLQPEGLVVSPQVLVDAQVILDRSSLRDLQDRFLECVTNPESENSTFGSFLNRGLDGRPFGLAIDFLDWAPDLIDLNGGQQNDPRFDSCACAVLPDLDAHLRPTAALRFHKEEDPARPYLLLTKELGPGVNFDEPFNASRVWETTHSEWFQRLLTETGVPLGVLSNGRLLRLFYAPRSESAGHMTFNVGHLETTAGRSMVAGLHALLQQLRLANAPGGKTLLRICEDSRKYQAKVSEQLSRQVLEALYELVRGFQAADDAKHGALLRSLLEGDDETRQDVYRGLLRTLMRSVFVLFAEDRGLLPTTGLYANNYSLHGLYERLRIDDGKHHDTMDSRYGAWAQLLTLFRLIHGGSQHSDLRLPARHGYLFDPDAYPFLEGRTLAEPEVPLVSDGCVYRVLGKLLLLEGERLSYRTLDVEQIGSVYETMMGFTMTVAEGPTVAIRPTSKRGAPTGVNLQAVLKAKAGERAKLVETAANTKLTPTQKKALQAATTLEGIEAALAGRIVAEATPRPVPEGGMVLQPSEERRKSGSHYTPRALTEPIVRKTLQPVLAALGAEPRPDQILDLKICDPAMGSGAFLVEVCRQLGKRLEQAWLATKTAPTVSAEDDLYRLACRTVAQRCIYGVDRNDMAVDLAKLSLWLVTLARDHSFTFLDHALRHGDSLVGLSNDQLESFHWDVTKTVDSPVRARRRAEIAKVRDLRRSIREAGDSASEQTLRTWWTEAQSAVEYLRCAGDLIASVFFEGGKPPEQQQKLSLYSRELKTGEWTKHKGRLAAQRRQQPPLAPFHWQLEFPEVFDRDNPGFDAFVGNPPFLGGRNLSAAQGAIYSKWLVLQNTESSGGADLAAHFFRRCFDLLRERGVFGLIATNTIAQGDTRSSGLRWICNHGGTIYSATRRFRWPGMAAVVVSIVHLCKGAQQPPFELDGRSVERITAFLFHAGGHDDPQQLRANEGQSFQGSIVLGMGFTFDDTDTKGVASSLADMRRAIEGNLRNQEVIFPYIGGEEVNSDPRHAHHRYVINFGERPEAECRRKWPELFAILEAKVKPERITKDATKYPRMVNEWWKFWNARSELQAAIAGMERVLAVTCGASPYANFTFLPQRFVFANSLAVFPLRSYAAFAALQGRPHEHWARFFGSSMKDDLRYTPSDCFETFPFPEGWQTNAALEAAGKAYYEFRAQLMIDTNLGLTKTYNHFHSDDPKLVTPEIWRLRELHAAMDRAVLDAYGWSDIPTACELIPDYLETDDEGNETPASNRYRWPDAVRDEVLARLLALNEQRHKAEVSAGLHGGGRSRDDLFDDDE
jgi:hypothetical protein